MREAAVGQTGRWRCAATTTDDAYLISPIPPPQPTIPPPSPTPPPAGKGNKNHTGFNSCQFGTLDSKWETLYAALPSQVFK